MHGMVTASVAELFQFQPFGLGLLVFRRCVIAIFAIRTLQRDNISHMTHISGKKERSEESKDGKMGAWKDGGFHCPQIP
jgi:hypothetical protein